MADFDGSVSQIGVSSSDRMPVRVGHREEQIMKHRWLGIVGTVLLVGTVAPTRLVAQTERGPYARIAMLRPHEGDTVDFEAGYIRHLEFHRQAKDAWTWYGWTIWAGERQRWFVYATFGHSAASLDNPVPPAEDERDNRANWNSSPIGCRRPDWIRSPATRPRTRRRSETRRSLANIRSR